MTSSAAPSVLNVRARSIWRKLSAAALRAIASQQDKDVPALLIKLWPSSAPGVRREILEIKPSALVADRGCLGHLILPRRAGRRRRDGAHCPDINGSFTIPANDAKQRRNAARPAGQARRPIRLNRSALRIPYLVAFFGGFDPGRAFAGKCSEAD